MAKFRKTKSRSTFSAIAWTLTKLNLSGTSELHFYKWHETADRMHIKRIKEFRRERKANFISKKRL